MFRADRLVEWRKKKKWTQEQLATQVNITKAGISNYENGHSSPPHDTLVALADTLGITTDYLLGRTDLSSTEESTDNLTSDQAEFEAFISNPEHGIFFKEYLDAPEERREEFRKIFEILRQREEDRKPGDRQGE